MPSGDNLRALRWRCLLAHLVKLSYGTFARVTVIGHGMNLLLPARLGELFRMETFKRKYGVARAWTNLNRRSGMK